MDALVKIAHRAKCRLRRLEQHLYVSLPIIRVESLFDLLAGRNAKKRTHGVPAVAGHVLIPTVGQGNIGDQAMLEAFIGEVEGPITLVLEASGSHQIPDEAKSRVSIELVSGLFNARPIRRLRSVRRLAQIVQGHESVSVIGADIMDGGYSQREALSRLSILRMCSEMDIPNRVLGFSWNGNPSTAVQSAIQRTQPMTKLCVRDRRSFDRLVLEPPSQVEVVSDVVFSLENEQPYEAAGDWIARQRSEGRGIVVVNASGLIMNNSMLLAEFELATRAILDRDLSVLLLPHVIRHGDDDLVACRRLADLVGPRDQVFLVEDLLTPGQVRWVASRSDCVLSGRMHLAILALNGGTPAAVLSTQGKVFGMLELFGLQQYCLEPIAGVGENAAEAVFALVNDAGVRDRIGLAIPKVRALSAANFHGLA